MLGYGREPPPAESPATPAADQTGLSAEDVARMDQLAEVICDEDLLDR